MSNLKSLNRAAKETTEHSIYRDCQMSESNRLVSCLGLRTSSRNPMRRDGADGYTNNLWEHTAASRQAGGSPFLPTTPTHSAVPRVGYSDAKHWCDIVAQTKRPTRARLYSHPFTQGKNRKIFNTGTNHYQTPHPVRFSDREQPGGGGGVNDLTDLTDLFRGFSGLPSALSLYRFELPFGDRFVGRRWWSNR